MDNSHLVLDHRACAECPRLMTRSMESTRHACSAALVHAQDGQRLLEGLAQEARRRNQFWRHKRVTRPAISGELNGMTVKGSDLAQASATHNPCSDLCLIIPSSGSHPPSPARAVLKRRGIITRRPFSSIPNPPLPTQRCRLISGASRPPRLRTLRPRVSPFPRRLGATISPKRSTAAIRPWKRRASARRSQPLRSISSCMSARRGMTGLLRLSCWSSHLGSRMEFRECGLGVCGGNIARGSDRESPGAKE